MVAEARGLPTAALLTSPASRCGTWRSADSSRTSRRRERQAELKTLMDQFIAATPEANQRHTASLVPTSRVPGPMRTPFFVFIGVLFALALALLAIAASNVAGLLLARASGAAARDGHAPGDRRQPRRLVAAVADRDRRALCGGGTRGGAADAGRRAGPCSIAAAAADRAQSRVGRERTSGGVRVRPLARLGPRLRTRAGASRPRGRHRAAAAWRHRHRRTARADGCGRRSWWRKSRCR